MVTFWGKMFKKISPTLKRKNNRAAIYEIETESGETLYGHEKVAKALNNTTLSS